MAGVAPGTEIAREWVRRYECGMYTRLEALTRLVQEAAEHPPAALAVGLPGEWLEELKERTTVPPASPDEVLYISGILRGVDFDYKAYFAQMRQSCFDGSWAWHRYFAERVVTPDSNRFDG